MKKESWEVRALTQGSDLKIYSGLQEEVLEREIIQEKRRIENEESVLEKLSGKGNKKQQREIQNTDKTKKLKSLPTKHLFLIPQKSYTWKKEEEDILKLDTL